MQKSLYILYFQNGNPGYKYLNDEPGDNESSNAC